MVKVDGQKADDAEVPIELWDKMFALTWATNLPGIELPRGWRQALGSLRKGFSVWWKRKVLRSWIGHIKRVDRLPRADKPPSEKKVRKCKAVVVWSRSPGLALSLPGSVGIGPGQKRVYAHDWVYDWEPEGREGYVQWFQARKAR